MKIGLVIFFLFMISCTTKKINQLMDTSSQDGQSLKWQEINNVLAKK